MPRAACLAACLAAACLPVPASAQLPVRFGIIPGDFYPYSVLKLGPNMMPTGDRPTGFFPDLLSELSHDMNWTVTYVPMMPKFAMGQDSYLHQVRDDIAKDAYDFTMIFYDAPTGPFAGFGADLSAVKQSVAFHMQINSVGIRKVTVSPPLFALFDPFTGDLWGAIVLFSVAYGALLLLLHRAAGARDGDEPRAVAGEAAHMQYHALAMVLAGEAFDNWRSAALRIARIGMLLFVLVFGATYTANLAAFFTKPSFTLIGPKSMLDLSTAKVCVQDPPVMGVVQQSIGPDSFLPPPWVLSKNDLLQSNQYCAACVLNGTADAMVGLKVNMRDYLHRGGCDMTPTGAIAHVANLDFSPVPFQFGYVPGNPRFAAAGRPHFGEDLDRALVKFMRTPKYTKLRSTWLYDDFFCPGDGPEEASAAPKVSFDQMRGLFLLCGVIGAAALATGLTELGAHLRDRKKKIAVDGGAEEAATEAGMLRILLAKVDDLRVQNVLAASTNKVADAFRIIDKDGGGTLTHGELFSGLRKHEDLRKIVGLRDDANFADFERLVADADSNDDKQVSLGEFEALCQKWAAAADNLSLQQQQQRQQGLSL